MQAMMSAPPAHGDRAPNWFESLLFVALMSGPPKFRERDPLASLTGTIDLMVVIHMVVWTCGGLWVLARLYPFILRRRLVPALNPAQKMGGVLILALSLSVWDSPGVLLTAFTLAQFAVMLTFLWLFTHRFGTRRCLHHLFICVTVLAVITAAATIIAPDFVTDESMRVRGDYIADTGIVAVIGLVFCLSNVPELRGLKFWAVLCLFGTLLAASRTRSAYVAFLAYLAFGFVYGKRLPVRKLVVPLLAIAFSVVLLDAFTSTTDYLVREKESVGTMSDRIPLWQHLTTTVMDKAPITGLGYYAASRVVATEYNPGLGNAHSAFFEILVGGGVLGVTIYLLLCASMAWFAARLLRASGDQPATVAAVGLLWVTVLMGVTTSAAFQAGPMGFGFWALTAVLPAMWRESCRARTLARYSDRIPSPRIAAPVTFGFAREDH
jgi:O-antigen ligase